MNIRRQDFILNNLKDKSIHFWKVHLEKQKAASILFWKFFSKSFRIKQN
jgi:hypothetical protein